MNRRLRSRWIRAKAWRIVRRHYMVSFTLAALALAAAGAAGLLESGGDEPQTAERRQAPPTRTPVPFDTPDPSITPSPLTVTYYLVDSEEDLRAYQGLEDEIIFREILETDDVEVLLVRDTEEEAEAKRVIERAQRLAQESGFILVIRDLRD